MYEGKLSEIETEIEIYKVNDEFITAYDANN